MKYILSFFFVMAALSAAAQQPSQSWMSDPSVALALSAVSPGGSAADAAHASAGDTFSVANAFSLGGSNMKIVRLSRSHSGLPVFNDCVTLEYSLTNQLRAVETVVVTPLAAVESQLMATVKISSAQAERYALEQFPYSNGKLRHPAREGYWIDPASHQAQLVWLVRIDGVMSDGQTPSRHITYVSTETLSVIAEDDDTRTILPVGRTNQSIEQP